MRISTGDGLALWNPFRIGVTGFRPEHGSIATGGERQTSTVLIQYDTHWRDGAASGQLR